MHSGDGEGKLKHVVANDEPMAPRNVIPFNWSSLFEISWKRLKFCIVYSAREIFFVLLMRMKHRRRAS